MKLTPGFSVSATLNALRTTSGMTSASRIWVAYFVIGRKRLTRSRCWWLSLCMRVVAACPAMATTGARSMLASATPVIRFVAPGPSVARQTPARPVSRPWTSAMKAAPCSCRVVMKRIELSSSSSMTSMFSSPGIPKIVSTPSFSRQRTNSSDAFMACRIPASPWDREIGRATRQLVTRVLPSGNAVDRTFVWQALRVARRAAKPRPPLGAST